MQTKKRGKFAHNKQVCAASLPTSRWLDEETKGCHFADERLERRFRALVEELSDCVGGSIPFACQDWANTKAAYRFFSNPRVSEADIFSGHFESTHSRFIFPHFLRAESAKDISPGQSEAPPKYLRKMRRALQGRW